LTGLPFANASLLDEATAAGEAMFLAFNSLKQKRKDFFVSSNIYPFIKDLLRSKAYFLNINIVEGDPNDAEIFKNNNFFGGIVQNPDSTGKVNDYTSFAEKLRENKAVAIISVDIASLLLTKSPKEMGFDIAIGSAQRFGVPMMNGGPHAGFLAAKDEFKRMLPGRIIGISRDRFGNKAYRLTMQTREQHIKRDKATSNICTAQALLANMSVFYSIFHGKQGLIDISRRINLLAMNLQSELEKIGFVFVNKNNEIFDTVNFNCKKSGFSSSNEIVSYFEANKINLRKINDEFVSLTINETTTLADIEELLNLFVNLKNKNGNLKAINITDFNWVNNTNSNSVTFSNNLRRENLTEILQQDIFNKYSSETQLLRYIHFLQGKDISLCNSMIPLGSCTMKLNSTSELVN
jgi:glycine dehydrogenase